jgi:beta-lactamase regulating signal transducer with metallopeptidase domain
MTDFPTAALTAAVQVTLAIIPSMFLVLLIGRRRATTSATLSVSALVVAAGLTAAACTPLPGSWSWARASHHASTDSASPSSAVRSAESYGPAWDIASLLRLLKPAAPAAELSRWSWRTIAAIGIGVCVAVSLATWFIGLLAITRLRSKSRPIANAGLHSILDELKIALSIRRTVELRTSSAIGSAATCGFRRPVILLAADWPSWSPADLRAVLAHELAHIRRCDFGVGMLARICVAVNGFHPLVHWLASRLRFAQELAADQLAALVAGGENAYRQALARMALRQDRAWLGGIARSFGSNRNSLLRRLRMLPVMEKNPLGRTARLALIGAVIAIGVTISAVRGPAQAPATVAPTAPLPPFDLGYLPANCDAFVAMRPGLLFGRPEMKPILDAYSKMVHAAFAVIGLQPGTVIPFDAIEQMIGPLELRTMTEEEAKRMPNGERHSIQAGLLFVRMNRDFDWAAIIRSLPKRMGVIEKESGYFELTAPMISPTPITLRVVDARTIVGSSANAEQVAERRQEMVKRFGSAFLAEVDRAGLAAVIDNRQARWTETIQSDPKFTAAMTALGKPAHIALCFHWNEHVAASLLTDWDTPPGDLNRGKETVGRLFGDLLRPTDAADVHERRFIDLASEMLRSVQVRQAGKLVKADMSASMRWADLLNAIMLNGTASVEAKEEKTEKK